MSTKIFSYKVGSRSSRTLSDALAAKVLKHDGSRWVPRARDTVINWGSSTLPAAYNICTVINKPDKVAAAANKLSFFQAMQLARENTPDLSFPTFWTSRDEIPDEAFPVVCRTVLNGHSGRGIVIADTREQLVDAPLYTHYIKKKDEYRVHASSTGIISIQRKAIRQGVEPDRINHRVRNLDNGYVFVRGDVNPDQQVLDQAVTTIQSLGLDFGAVDIIWNDRQQKAYVLEVNTAPGLEGQTIEDYRTYFEGVL